METYILFIGLAFAILIIAIVLTDTIRDAAIVITLISAVMSICINAGNIHEHVFGKNIDIRHGKPSATNGLDAVITSTQPPKDSFLVKDNILGSYPEAIYFDETTTAGDFIAGPEQVKHLAADNKQSGIDHIDDVATKGYCKANTAVSTKGDSHQLPTFANKSSNYVNNVDQFKNMSARFRVRNRNKDMSDKRRIADNKWRYNPAKQINSQALRTNRDNMAKYFNGELEHGEKSVWWGNEE